MANKQMKPKMKVINEANPSSLGKSLVEIFDIAGKNTDFSTYNKLTEKQRLFKDEKGVFREMDERKRKKGIKIIAE